MRYTVYMDIFCQFLVYVIFIEMVFLINTTQPSKGFLIWMGCDKVVIAELYGGRMLQGSLHCNGLCNIIQEKLHGRAIKVCHNLYIPYTQKYTISDMSEKALKQC